MSERKKLIAAVRDLMQAVRKTNADFVQTICHDYICGSWVAEFSHHTASIIKMNNGYMATVYLRGKLVEQLHILSKNDRLEIDDCAGARPLYIYHDPQKQTLFIGRYGRFVRDHQTVDDEYDLLDYLFIDSTANGGEDIKYTEMPLNDCSVKNKTIK
jgi:hypothetical protein